MLVRLIYYKFSKEIKINKLVYLLKIYIDFFILVCVWCKLWVLRFEIKFVVCVDVSYFLW